MHARAALGLFLLSATAGCPAKEQEAVATDRNLARCLADHFEVEPCAAACEAGELEKGCLTAALRAAKKAKMEGGDPAAAAAKYDGAACDGGVVEGCVRLVNRMAVGFEEALALASPKSGRPWPDVTPARIAERDGRAKQACTLKSALGCRWLGNFLFGQDNEAARAAYRQGCEGEGNSAAVCATVEAAFTAHDKARAACTEGSAAACTEARYLVFFHDPMRGLAAFAEEHAARGLGDALDVAAFTTLRVRDEQRWRPAWMLVPPRFGVPDRDVSAPVDAGAGVPAPWQPAADPAGIASMDVVDDGGVSTAELTSALRAVTPDVLRCYAPARPAGLKGEIALTVHVDGAGDAYGVDVESKLSEPRLVACVAHVFDRLHISSPDKRVAHVRLRVDLR